MHPVDAIPGASPFRLDDSQTYQRWREWKLTAYPLDSAALMTELLPDGTANPPAEARMRGQCRRVNMAFYTVGGGADGRQAVQNIARRFGLTRADGHLCADADGIATLQVSQDALKRGYIPYTDRPINWHTDGYYNAPDRWIRSMMLHCQQPAAEGGGNACIDPEMIYIQLRDIGPEYVKALMAPGCMTIPANRDEEGELRPEQSGPVFSVDPRTGALHMRYTARKRNILWSKDPLLQEALACLESLLADDNPYVVHHRLEAGQGLLCNNVLHRRSGFSNGGQGAGRTFYRARFYERIAGTMPESDALSS